MTQQHGRGRLMRCFGRSLNWHIQSLAKRAWTGPCSSIARSLQSATSCAGIFDTELPLHRYSDDELHRMADQVTNELRRDARGALMDPLRFVLRIAAKVIASEEHASDCKEAQDSQALSETYLQQLVDRLPSEQREYLLLHVNDGLTYRDIAQRYGVEREIVLDHLKRAYASVRDSMREEERLMGKRPHAPN